MTINSNINGNWSAQNSKLKKRFPALTVNGLFFEIGRKNEILAPLQVKVNNTKEDLQQILKTL